MADIADIANDYAALMLEHSINAHRSPAKGDSRADCLDCGDDIPPARQNAVAGVQRCVPCADLADLKARGVRRG